MASKGFLHESVLKGQGNSKQGLSVSHKNLFLFLFLVVTVVVFDVSVSSSSTLIFRLLYDSAFALIMFAFGYVCFCLLTGKQFSWKGMTLGLPKLFVSVPLVLNGYVLCSILFFGNPQLGVLNENVLFQGLLGLLPLLIFVLVMGVNALVVYVAVSGAGEVQFFKLAGFLLAVVAVEACVSIYGFYLGGLEGLCWGLCVLHLGFIVLSFFVSHKICFSKVKLGFSTSDLMLLLVSVGVFALVYVPFGFYNLYNDNAVVLGSALSVAARESLQPYYLADLYYSPVMGFVALVFSYTTGFNSLISVCNLPFMLGSLLLPYVAYHFISSYVTGDSVLAVLGAVVVCLMDGLAVLVLPGYLGNLSEYAIQWQISPVTMSLYTSNICHLWLVPFKAFTAASAIAACSLLHKRHAVTYILAGALFFVCFMNPRYLLLAIILLIFLFGIRKISFKGLAVVGLSALVFGGFTLSVHFYKQLRGVFLGLYNSGLINEAGLDQLNSSLEFLVYDSQLLILGLVVCGLLGIVVLARTGLTKKLSDEFLCSRFSGRNLSSMVVGLGGKSRSVLVSATTLISVSILLAVFIYVLLHAYSVDFQVFLSSNSVLSALNRIILRYHVLVAFFAAGLLLLRYPRRVAFTFGVVLLVFFISGLLSNSVSLLPMIFVVLALPLVCFCNKNKRRFSVLLLLCFIFLGVFSSVFYSATVVEPVEQSYSDLSPVLELLLENEPGQRVYSPSNYTYFVTRVVAMAHLYPSTDSASSLCLIDKDYTQTSVLNQYLSDDAYTVLFEGNKFVLMKLK